jgi:lipid II:glycine glycyltransferase (peptidoglycan interpeptide bridge formation enzyme)
LINSISEVFVARKMAVVFVARLYGKIIAALVLFTVNREGTYAYNFSDSKYLKFHPNHALLWAAIEWSIRNGLSAFDLGISSPQDNQLLLFKRRWGGSELNVRDYFIAPGSKSILPDRRASLKYKSATIAWRFLVPSFVASTVGPSLISHLE